MEAFGGDGRVAGAVESVWVQLLGDDLVKESECRYVEVVSRERERRR